MKRHGLDVGIAACAALLALAACAGGSAEYKPLAQYASAARVARDSGAPVAIRGTCYNSCVVQLGGGNVYIDPDAVFAAHVSWPGYQSDARLTAVAYRGVPACARAVLERGARSAFDPLARVYGSQILSACPDMKPLLGIRRER